MFLLEQTFLLKEKVYFHLLLNVIDAQQVVLDWLHEHVPDYHEQRQLVWLALISYFDSCFPYLI